jgi:glycosyltransferase involved in cell wall biosynthesis
MSIRICLVSSFPPVKGGEAWYAQNFVSAIDTYLANEISEIHVLSHFEGKTLNPYENNGKVHVYRLYDSLDFISRNIAFLRIFRKIIRIRPDVVHLEYSAIPFGRYGGFLGESLFLLFLLLKMLHIPIYVTLHSLMLPDQVQERAFERVKNKALAVLAKRYFIGFTHYFGRMVQTLFLLVNTKNSKLIRRFCIAYDLSSSHVKEEVHGIWIDKGLTYSEAKQNSKRIVCLGIMFPNKGYEYAIEAMKIVLQKHPTSSLIIAGSYPPTNHDEGKKYIEKLRNTVKNHRLGDAVTIEERYLSDDEFVQYIKTATIVLLPYSRSIASSGIMHLAMIYKIPVILAGSGLSFEELSDFVPVVPPMNSEALAKEITNILGSEDYCTRIVEKYEGFLENHDWAVVSKTIFREYSNRIYSRK